LVKKKQSERSSISLAVPGLALAPRPRSSGLINQVEIALQLLNMAEEAIVDALFQSISAKLEEVKQEARTKFEYGEVELNFQTTFGEDIWKQFGLLRGAPQETRILLLEKAGIKFANPGKKKKISFTVGRGGLDSGSCVPAELLGPIGDENDEAQEGAMDVAQAAGQDGEAEDEVEEEAEPKKKKRQQPSHVKKYQHSQFGLYLKPLLPILSDLVSEIEKTVSGVKESMREGLRMQIHERCAQEFTGVKSTLNLDTHIVDAIAEGITGLHSNGTRPKSEQQALNTLIAFAVPKEGAKVTMKAVVHSTTRTTSLRKPWEATQRFHWWPS